MTAIPVLLQTPKVWNASIGNGDASLWKKLLSLGVGAGASGSKVVALSVSSNDTSARNIQLAHVKSGVATLPVASPGVVSIAAVLGNNLAVGDQVWFETTGTLPTGVVAGTTYFVISAGFSAGVSFEIGATAGGAAINFTGSSSGTHTIFMPRPLVTANTAITAGQDGVTAAVNLLTASLVPGLPVDNDGQQYILLESGDYLAVSSLSTVTANKIVSAVAIGGSF